jgi:transposase
MARIVEHLSVEELEARYRTARDVAEARHAQAIWLLAQGRTVLEVAEVLAFAPRWVTRLAARYNAFGPDALGDRRRHNGKAAGLLTPDLLAALAERVRTPPEDGGLWSGPKVALWMARRLGLAKVHAQRGWEALRRIGWSIQAPRPRHPRAATPEQREALKKTWTRRSRGPRRRTPTGRSRSGPRTNTASA